MHVLNHARLLATPWTVAHQAPLSMGLSRQEYWGGWPFPSPRDLPLSPESSCIGRQILLPLSHLGSPRHVIFKWQNTKNKGKNTDGS